MGGLGSGRWQRYAATVGEVAAVGGSVRVRDVEARLGPFPPDTVALEVRLTDTDGTRQHNVRLVSAAQPFGGVRWWWCCDGCGRRRATLYRLGRSPFRCRVCLGLTYGSRRESAYHRSRRRLDTVGRRLGLAPGEAEEWGGELPDRPPRMRWWTYARLADAWGAAIHAGNVAFFADCRRVGVPVDDIFGADYGG